MHLILSCKGSLDVRREAGIIPVGGCEAEVNERFCNNPWLTSPASPADQHRLPEEHYGLRTNLIPPKSAGKLPRCLAYSVNRFANRVGTACTPYVEFAVPISYTYVE